MELLGRREEAYADYRLALLFPAKLTRHHNSRGFALYKLERYEEVSKNRGKFSKKSEFDELFVSRRWRRTIGRLPSGSSVPITFWDAEEPWQHSTK